MQLKDTEKRAKIDCSAQTTTVGRELSPSAALRGGFESAAQNLETRQHPSCCTT